MTRTSLYFPGDPWNDVDPVTGNADGLAQLEIPRPDELLRDFSCINVAAPMVRYSKLPARYLFARYNCHIINTPMMLAREFSRNAKARDCDFSTHPHERGIFDINGRRVRGSLIAQFAARNGEEFAAATELMYKHVDGVDLNCGCPQTWAYKEEIGSFLLRQPHLVQDMIKQARARVGSSFPISVKIRLDKEPEWVILLALVECQLTLFTARRTSQLVQTAIHAGASYIGVHGRTRHQKDSEPVNLAGIKFACEEAKGAVPVIGNGDVYTLEDAERMRAETGVQGAMSARGLLENPALFAGHHKTPYEAMQHFVDISTSFGFQFGLFQRHMAWMLTGHFKNKHEKRLFNELTSYAAAINWLDVFIEKRKSGDLSFITPDAEFVSSPAAQTQLDRLETDGLATLFSQLAT